jgi:hypothetical protein
MPQRLASGILPKSALRISRNPTLQHLREFLDRFQELAARIVIGLLPDEISKSYQNKLLAQWNNLPSSASPNMNLRNSAMGGFP